MDYTKFNAQAARELTSENKDYFLNQALKSIKISALKGLRTVIVQNLSSDNVEKLQEFGYGVEAEDCKYSNSAYKVTW